MKVTVQLLLTSSETHNNDQRQQETRSDWQARCPIEDVAGVGQGGAPNVPRSGLQLRAVGVNFRSVEAIYMK